MMSTHTDIPDSMLEASAIVVAHPDDEVLWFSSVAGHVDHIYICFLEYPPDAALGRGRREAISNHPLLDKITCLDLDEADSFNCADWNAPEIDSAGLRLLLKKHSIQRYTTNYATLYATLGNTLKGIKNVFTHNPWGEYGHEDHVQVYRVIHDLQKEHHFDIWINNYCGNRSIPLFLNYASGFHSDYMLFPTDTECFASAATVYRKHGCWTWYNDFVCFKEEAFMRPLFDMESGRQKSCGHLFPLNMIKTNFPLTPPGYPRYLAKLIKGARRFFS